MPFNDPLTYGEPDARASNTTIKPLKDSEDLPMISRRNTSAVILHRKDYLVAIRMTRDVNAGLVVCFPVLNTVLKQVLQNLHNLGLIAVNGREVIMRHNSACFLDQAAKVHH